MLRHSSKGNCTGYMDDSVLMGLRLKWLFAKVEPVADSVNGIDQHVFTLFFALVIVIVDAVMIDLNERAT